MPTKTKTLDELLQKTAKLFVFYDYNERDDAFMAVYNRHFGMIRALGYTVTVEKKSPDTYAFRFVRGDFKSRQEYVYDMRIRAYKNDDI